MASASSLCSSVTRCCIRSQGRPRRRRPPAPAFTARARITAGVGGHGSAGSGTSRSGSAIRSMPVAANDRNSATAASRTRVASSISVRSVSRVPSALPRSLIACLLKFPGRLLVGVAAFGISAELVQFPVQLLDRCAGGLQQRLVQRLGGGRRLPGRRGLLGGLGKVLPRLGRAPLWPPPRAGAQPRTPPQPATARPAPPGNRPVPILTAASSCGSAGSPVSAANSFAVIRAASSASWRAARTRSASTRESRSSWRRLRCSAALVCASRTAASGGTARCSAAS